VFRDGLVFGFELSVAGIFLCSLWIVARAAIILSVLLGDWVVVRNLFSKEKVLVGKDSDYWSRSMSIIVGRVDGQVVEKLGLAWLL